MEARHGIHAQRLPLAGILLPDWALWDVVGTVILAVSLAYGLGRPFPEVLTELVVLATVCHLLLGVDHGFRRALLMGW